MSKVVQEKETLALKKLEQSAKAEEAQEEVEALPRPTRPPPWSDKFRTCQSGAKSEKQSRNRDESMLWLASPYLEHEVSIQEGVPNFHLCLSA